jgi:hypothetical protein
MLEYEVGLIQESDIEAKVAEYAAEGRTLRSLLDDISNTPQGYLPEHLRGIVK